MVVGTGGELTATFCTGGGSATFDTYLSVYCISCDPAEAVCVAGNDDYCGLQSQVSWCSEPSAEYYIKVHGFSTANGNFNLYAYESSPTCSDPVACLPQGACCLCLPEPYHCQDISEPLCTAMGGIWLADTECELQTVLEQFFVSTPEIPIYDYSYATDTISVPVGTGSIGDVNIRVEITHSWQGDMGIDVEHLGNTENLWDHRCGSWDNIFGTFDEEGWEIYCTGIGQGPSGDNHILLDGYYSGYGILSDFDGMDADGDWTISIYDWAGGDTGTLHEWAVELSSVLDTEYPCEGIYPGGGPPGTPTPGDEDEEME
jgi:subtilisin-like proprotein convertase family protein